MEETKKEFTPRPERAERPQRGRRRRKVCAFCVDKVEHVDYKDAGKLAQVYVRARQDPAPPYDRHLRCATSAS